MHYSHFCLSDCVLLRSRVRRRHGLNSRLVRSILLTILLTLLLIFSLTLPALADERIIFTGHFNYDKSPDSLVAEIDSLYKIIPQRIKWGVCDSVLCDTSGTDLPAIADSLRVTASMLVLPGWNDLEVEIACLRLNPVSDSLHDLLLYCKGTVTVDSLEVDTSRVIALFGQHGLDTLPTLDLSVIGDAGLVQTSPFHAMEYRAPTEFIDEEVRDASENPSWIIRPLILPVSVVEEAAAPPNSALWATMPTSNVVIHPNPVGSSTTVSSENLPPGRYRIEVMDLSGRVLLRKDNITVDAARVLATQIPLGELTTGYYILRLTDDAQIEHALPFVIAH